MKRGDVNCVKQEVLLRLWQIAFTIIHSWEKNEYIHSSWDSELQVGQFYLKH